MKFDGTEAEICAQCGFDSRKWQRPDATALFELLGSRWREMTSGLSVEDLNRRPRPLVWSALEYGLHSAMVIPILRDAIERILASDGCVASDPCPDLDTEDNTQPLVLCPTPILDALEREGAALARLAAGTNKGWGHWGYMDDGQPWQAEATLFHAAHDTTHHLADVADGLFAIGAR